MKHPLGAALGIGAVVGAIALGIGGRVAMRVFGETAGQPAGFSLGGTATVVFLGALSGMVGGAVLWLGRRILPRWPLARGALFWIVVIALALRGLRPLSAHRLVIFGPVILIYGITVYGIWCRRHAAMERRTRLIEP